MFATVMDERKLILGLKKGDHDSYETLFDLYYAKFETCRSRCRSNVE